MTALICIATALVLICAVYLWLVFPAVRRRDVRGFCLCPIAHRGVHDDDGVAENSMSAFRIALKAELPIELDVRLTRDGVPVVIHDSSLSRLCGVDARVEELTYSECLEYRLLEGGEKIPALSEVLKLIDGRVPLLIELKGEDTSPVAEGAYSVLESYSGEYAVESFNPYYLHRYRQIAPRIPLGFLSYRRVGRGFNEKLFAVSATHLLFNFAIRPDFIAYRYTDRMPLGVKLCRLFGAKVMVWTVKDADAYRECKRKYDGVIAERIFEITK